MTPPPDSTSEVESSSDEEDMTSKAEIRIGQPAIFDGKSADASYWMGSVHAYIALNRHIYNDDTKKITFALSYCKEGAAKSWALG